jgi:DegV family protein with EDD domain
MKIRYLDGPRLYHAFLAGGNAVIQDQGYLNKINVFPVPDADTGTNLASTMRSIARGAVASRTMKATLASIAQAALYGARGNSGLIFAQYIYGISRELGNERRVAAAHFAESVKKAVAYATRSILTPVEGTMITIIRDWADAVYAERHRTHDYAELLSGSLEAARRSLQETPKKLALLAKAGVVDAGAKGFVDFLEGVVHFIRKGDLKSVPIVEDPPAAPAFTVHRHPGPLRHRYCSEALLTGSGLDVDLIRGIVQEYGDSAIVAGSDELVRIHVHADDPAGLFSKIREHGSVAQIKVDDMRRQQEAVHAPKGRIALVVDSACDLPAEVFDRHQIHLLPFQVSFGTDLFLDKLTITPDQFYSLFEAEAEPPRSSQPSAAGVEALFAFLGSHYESIIVLTLSEKMSGLYSACRVATEKEPGLKIAIVNSRGISAQTGLVALRAAEAIEAGMSHEDVTGLCEEWVAKSAIYVDVTSIRHMLRSGRLGRMKGLLANVLKLKPIVTIDREGRGTTAGKSFTRDGNMKKIVRRLRKIASERPIHAYAIVHAKDPDRAEAFAARLTEALGRPPEFVMSASPVIGVHVGPGLVAVALSCE